MAYVKQGPWGQGGILNSAQATAMDEGIANAQAADAADLGSVSGAVTLDAVVASAFTVSLAGDATFTFANIHQSGLYIEVSVFLTANGHAATFSDALFEVGQPGVLAGAPDVLRFLGSPSGSTVYGRLVASY